MFTRIKVTVEVKVKKFLVLLPVLLTAAIVANATKAEDHTSGPPLIHEIIHSSILLEERPIRIQLPRGYEQSESQYPVLFILDAEHEEHFNWSLETTDLLTVKGQIPEMIIVGIENVNRLRDMSVPVFENKGKTVVGGAEKFLRFLEKELIPFVNEEYRTSTTRTLYGVSASATFSIFTMVTQPTVFDAYVAASPSFFVNYDIINANARNYFATDKDLDKVFFMNLGTEDHEKRVTQTRAFAELVEQLAPPVFRWELRVMGGVGHVPRSSLEDGLRMIFSQATTN